MAVAGLAAGSAQAGPISTYYLTAGDQGTNWIVQGTTATPYDQANDNEYAIAVSGDVRTLWNGNQGFGAPPYLPGSQYTLAGVYTGTDYAYPVTDPSVAFYDGTTDGNFNYSVDFQTGNVYQMDRDWSNPVLLFDTTFGGFNALGITYDTGTGTLWVSQWGGDQVSNFTLGGTLLSFFNTGFGSISSLAYDPADGTLWMGSQGNKGTFSQFSAVGVLLSTETYANLLDQNTLGGEFNINPTAIPEPASLSLVAVAAAVGVARRRRKRVA